MKNRGGGWPVIVNQESEKDSCPDCPDPVGEKRRDEGSLFYGTRIRGHANFEFQFSSFPIRRVTSRRHRAALAPEVQMRNDVEQDQGEGNDARDDAEPREHEPAFVPARRRHGYSKHEVEPPEYFCQEFDHDAPEEMRRNGGNSVRHRADFFFHCGDIDHDDGVPRAAIQEAAVGAFAEALLAADALDGVNLDAPERRIVLVRHPEHAIFHRAVFDAGGRARAAGAALGNDGQFFRLFLARGGDALRARLKLLLVGHHSWSFDSIGCVCHFQRFYLECQAFATRGLATVSFLQVGACYNARAVGFVSSRTHVYQDFCQTSRARFAGRTRLASLFHLALPLLFWRYGLLRRACPQLAVPRRLRLLLPRAACGLGCARARLSGISRRDLFSGGHGPDGRHAGASVRRSCDVRVGGGHRPSSGHRRARPCAHPCRSGSALAHGALSLHSELYGGAAHGSLGDIFHYACAAGFSVLRGNGNRSHRLQRRSSSQRKNLVRGRTRGWSWNPGSPGNAVTSGSRSDFPVATLSPSRELEKTHACNSVADRWSAAAAGAVGRAQCSESRAGTVSRAALRRNVRRRFANRVLFVDKNVDVSVSRRVSLHVEIGVATNRREESSFVRRGFSGRIFARRFPAGALQPRAQHDSPT